MSRSIVDLSCFKHITLYKHLFDSYEATLTSNVIFINNSPNKAIRIGSIIIELFVNEKINRIKFKDLLHISEMKKNLLLMN